MRHDEQGDRTLAARIPSGAKIMNAKRILVAGLILVLALASTACGIMSVSTEGGELV